MATPAGTGHVVRFNVGTLQYTSAAYTSSIAAGSTANIAMTSGVWPATVGSFTLTATADSTTTVAESNETNNSFSRSLSVTDTQAPTVSPTFPGATETLTGDLIVIRSLRQVAIKPNATDNVAVTSTTVTVNSVLKTADASGNYLLDNKNGNYAALITAKDAANNTLNRTITVKVRHPDIVRDNAVDFDDFTRMLIQWNTNNPESDLSDNGLVDFDDFTKLLLAWTG